MADKLLFVASEAYPLIKTGGLADVAGSLPEALRQRGMDVRLLLPAYADLLARLEGDVRVVTELALSGERARLLECLLPGTGLLTWLVDHPLFSGRPGNPYLDAAGAAWPDNAQRFALLCRAAARIGGGDAVPDWRPDIMHCNDWHTGPAIPLAQREPRPPRSVFTIHSLAHQGVFDRATFDSLGLPPELWSEQGLEFYGQCSFMKAGLVFADYITTVSPSYAREVCSAPGGMGLEGLLSQRSDRLVGILNGIDDRVWNPAADPFLASPFDAGRLDQKAANGVALRREFDLDPHTDRPLLGFVGRLVEQKGLDLMLPVLGQLLDTPAQAVLLGSGERRYEEALRALAAARPGQVAVVLAQDEGLAHRIEAGADIFLMPSLFEPCGLNQMYSLRYGTLPVVRAVGGLADTVVDASEKGLESGEATGFVFAAPTPGDFLDAAQRAVGLWHDRPVWRGMQRSAMARDFSWRRSAERYLEIYRLAQQL